MPANERSRPGLSAWREDEAERRLEEISSQIRLLEVRRCRELSRIAAARHHRFKGCASIVEYGRRFGLRPCETIDRTKAGHLLELQPEVEAALIEGQISLQAAAALYEVISLVDEDRERWTQAAYELPSVDFVAKVDEHLAARRMGGHPVRVLMLLSPHGKSLLSRARELAERKCRRSLTEGEAVEVISDDYVERYDPLLNGRSRRPPPSPTEVRGRYVPARVRYEVRARDGDCCVVPACRKRGRVDIGHIEPFRRGGPPTKENLLVLCPLHNQMMEAGLLRIEGTADDPRFLDARGLPYVVKSRRGTRRPDHGDSERPKRE